MYKRKAEYPKVVEALCLEFLVEVLGLSVLSLLHLACGSFIVNVKESKLAEKIFDQKSTLFIPAG